MAATGELLLDETFSAGELDSSRWIAHYLPHWTTPERSAARYRLVDEGLELAIEADQLAWGEEEGELRVSNIQSGTWSGPLGSGRGQHRHTEGVVVRSPQRSQPLFTPTGGRFEATLRACPDPTTMLAFWLVGFEEASSDDSGEICVVELFGDSIRAGSATLSVGVKAHHDPRLRDDMVRVPVALDATAWHTYAADWLADEIVFSVDDVEIHRVTQVMDYPMQIMVGIFEFPPPGARDAAAYPKLGGVHSVRVHAR
jgi:hypothetical protein